MPSSPLRDKPNNHAMRAQVEIMAPYQVLFALKLASPCPTQLARLSKNDCPDGADKTNPGKNGLLGLPHRNCTAT